jgi:hypothetical protein
LKGANQIFFSFKWKRKDYQKAKEKIYEKRMVLIEGWDPNEEEIVIPTIYEIFPL